MDKTQIEVEHLKKQAKGLLHKKIAFKRVTLTQRALFFRHMSLMLKSGLTITESLEISQKSSSGKLAKMIANVLKSVESGRSLSSSLTKYRKLFPNLVTGIIHAGEESGNLDENLEIVAQKLEREREIISRIKSAMVYPAVILGAAFLLSLFIAFYILPQIIPLLMSMDIELPLTTRILIYTTDIVKDYGFKLFLGIVIFVVAVLWLLRARFMQPFTHKVVLKFPIIRKLASTSNLSRGFDTIASLLKSGITISQSVELTEGTVTNYYYKAAFSSAVERVKRGGTISESLGQYPDLFPLLTVKMIQVGETSGRLEEVLFYLGGFYSTELDTATKTLSAALEPALLLGIGLTVGFLALAIITPIYNITGRVR